jgi:oxygen-independent coproporphyrinogen-3 oxidase
MFEATQEILSSAGLPAYEISNHARPGAESRHNLAYWHYDDYIGIGPGAHGRYRQGEKRFAAEDHRAPEVWLEHVKTQGHGRRVQDEINLETAKREALMMGLRLTQGIDRAAWQKKFGESLDNFLPAEKIARLKDENYIANDVQNFKATSAGLQRLNAILAYIAA